jgi:SAM-dependent methyltransferase
MVYAAVNRIWAPFAAIPLGNSRCDICDHRVGRFLPFEGGWRAAPRLLAELDCIGSDLDHFACPRCGSHDRERHLFLYMSRSGLLQELRGKVVVHFAPERHLADIIARAAPARHIKCDLFPNGPDVRREDLLDMSFESDSVDLFIANHVMEHVNDDRQAVSEISRVLKVGGRAILQTPFSPVLVRTWEDAGINAPEARLQAYGQADHVRHYGRDFVDRIESFGLASLVRAHTDVLPDIDPRTAGVNGREPFLMFERRA